MGYSLSFDFNPILSFILSFLSLTCTEQVDDIFICIMKLHYLILLKFQILSLSLAVSSIRLEFSCYVQDL